MFFVFPIWRCGSRFGLPSQVLLCPLDQVVLSIKTWPEKKSVFSASTLSSTSLLYRFMMFAPPRRRIMQLLANALESDVLGMLRQDSSTLKAIVIVKFASRKSAQNSVTPKRMHGRRSAKCAGSAQNLFRVFAGHVAGLAHVMGAKK